MEKLDRLVEWWKDWDAGPLIRMALWSSIAAVLAWRRWHVTPVDCILGVFKCGFALALVSCAFLEVYAFIFCVAIHVYLFFDDLLYGVSERLVLAAIEPGSRGALLTSAILLELGFVASVAAMLAAGAGGRL